MRFGASAGLIFKQLRDNASKRLPNMVNNYDAAMLCSRRTQEWNKRMDWEDALPVARGGEISSHPATYYRRQAARAREIAKGVTTRAIKSRLLDEALHLDELAGKAENPATLY